ncbi:MAG: hypothetical protein CMC08_04785 [Flavobacteriaceae bacterium]|nr:hypothetical protein [Flavobacteriaceae bacterium]
MRLYNLKNTILVAVLICFSCGSQNSDKKEGSANETVIHDTVAIDKFIQEPLVLGIAQPQRYLPKLHGKNVGVIANQTSVMIDEVAYVDGQGRDQKKAVTQHLVDFLRDNGIAVTKVFAPEHGFRGTADAGEVIKDGIDTKTGIPIISLYGSNKKPTKSQLEGIDILVFDIQDGGARFYTYISTLHYIMEAAAQQDIPLIVLDRPNPNGHYIDGPILEPQHSSFVGMHPVPVVHGLTIGEYAKMINGEGWLANQVKADLTVVPMENYTRDMEYALHVKPSPNLPNSTAVNLYPSLCFFEGTPISAGRGTSMQFQVFGAPFLPAAQYGFTFTPQSNEGAQHPKFKGTVCHGNDLRSQPRLEQLNLEWLIAAYADSGKRKDFFTDFFTKLAGTETLQQQIESGMPFSEIRKSWHTGLEKYRAQREKYLLYN